MAPTTYVKEDYEFYPTPKALADKMLEGLDFNYISTVLEPSAGKGDLLKALQQKEGGYGWHVKHFDVDCIEKDPYLRQILKYNFDKDNTKETFENGIHIIHDDFMTYTPYKTYNLILMNPPFSEGDKHLLKALEMQKKGGSVVCLLNAETIKNPYTESRKQLRNLLDKYNASIEFLESEFVNAERKTNVEVAIVKVYIPYQKESNDLFDKMKKGVELDETIEDFTSLDVTDMIKCMVAHFNAEVKAGLELIRLYQGMQPLLTDSLDVNDKYSQPILKLVGYRNEDISSNEYLRSARLKYWKALFSNPKFTSKFTSDMQQTYREKVADLADYDFSEFNIGVITAEMNVNIKKGIEEQIMIMFDKMTAEHSYYPEFSKNRHYYNGWCTNKAWKVNKKVILPCYGIFSDYGNHLYLYNARETLEDIERILNYFDGNITQEINSWQILGKKFDEHETKNIQLKYFKVTFYKKGTVHITFTNDELLNRFNIYAAQSKQWLPPSYGKKVYTDMDEAEKSVIDDFQGEAEYNKVMKNKEYYLQSPVKNILSLNMASL